MMEGAETRTFRHLKSAQIEVWRPAIDAASGRLVGTAGDAMLAEFGSAVTAVMEGSRPMLIEIQALAVKSGFGTPQRVATGLDHRRLAVLLAVLERRAGLPFHDLDVFVNVTGGMRLVEPASDLAVVAALCSAVHDRPVPADALFVGEVGLGGEVRPVAALERRFAEAERLGFHQVFLSARSRPGSQIRATPVAHVAELTRRLAA